MSKEETLGNSVTVTTGCDYTGYWPYTPVPPCYEPTDPCENCPYKNSCKKIRRPYYPIYPDIWWYYDPNYGTYCMTISTPISNFESK